MFLMMLSEDQKKLFMEFAYAMAAADDNIAPEEIDIMRAYMAEMEFEITEKPALRQIDDILADINRVSDIKTKKIFLFEIIGLIMADGVYNDAEKEIIKKALQEFDLDSHFEEQCIQMVQDYLNIQQIIISFVIGEE